MAIRSHDGDGSIPAAPGRAAVLGSLRRAREPLTVRQLADRVALHPNSVRFHLVRLVAAGLVHEDQAGPSGRGRPRLIYTAEADPGRAAVGARPEVHADAADRRDGPGLLAVALAEHLARHVADPRDVAEQAGEERGRDLVTREPTAPPASRDAARAEVLAVMERTGFSPAWDDDEHRMWLRACPFRPLADEVPDVVCALHLGLLRGVLDVLDAPLEALTLESNEAPHPCVARFGLREPGAGPIGTGAAGLHVADPTRRSRPA